MVHVVVDGGTRVLSSPPEILISPLKLHSTIVRQNFRLLIEVSYPDYRSKDRVEFTAWNSFSTGLSSLL